jgi:hypothetical protein
MLVHCSLALEGQPLAALDRLLAATKSGASMTDMQLFDLRSVLTEALCKHPTGGSRLLEVLELPGPPLPAATLQQAVQALATHPNMLPAAWSYAQRISKDSEEDSSAVLEALWCAALTAGEAGQPVLDNIVKEAACLPAPTVARMLVATWSVGDSYREHHHQLASVLVFQLVVNADLLGSSWSDKAMLALMPSPAKPVDLRVKVARLYSLLHEAWQGMHSSQPQSIQPWAMEQILPLLAGVKGLLVKGREDYNPAFGTQLVQSLLQGGHGQYVAEEYRRIVDYTGLQLRSTEQAQLLKQAGPAKALVDAKG